MKQVHAKSRTRRTITAARSCERLAKLMRHAALIKVGAATGSEMKEKKARAALANGSSIA